MIRLLRRASPLVALVVACSSADDPGGDRPPVRSFLGSCDTRSVAGPSFGECREWLGDSNADLSVSCDGLDGTFSATLPCPVEGKVGTCTLEPILGARAVYGYYDVNYGEPDARDHCAGLEGTFSGTAGSEGDGGAGCPPECFRPYECVAACGDTPTNNGCCPCPAGTLDVITCP